MARPKIIDRERALALAAEILEKQGYVQVKDVAMRLGVQGPSMYRHFTGRDELMRRLADHGYRILGEHLHKAVAKERSFPSLARAYRAFAQKHPRLYHHMHRPGDSPKKGTALARYVLEPVARVLKIGINDERFLPNLRALRAYVHGFVSLEAAKQFPWGGDIEKAFERGLDLLAKSLD